MGTIDTRVFWNFLNSCMDEKVGRKENLLEEIRQAEEMIAHWNMFRKRYYGACYPTNYSDCEYTKEDIERFRVRMEKALDFAVRKICWINRACQAFTGEKFITCYIALNDSDNENRKMDRRLKIQLVEDFENLDYSIKSGCEDPTSL